jgi:hypothetical protein
MSNLGTGTAGTILQGQGAGESAAYSTASYPSSAGTANNVLVSDGTNIVSSQMRFTNSVGTNSTSGNPVDSTTYYLTNGASTIASTLALQTAARFYATYDCTINNVYGAFRVGGTLGTTEAVTLFIRKNDTTSTTISSAIVLNAADVPFSATSLNVSLVAGDYIVFGFTTPAWVTNPTLVGVALTFS